MDLIKELESLKLEHYVCEDDPWYTCPKSGQPHREIYEGECHCRADEHNEKLDEIIKELKEILK